ncbi:hypothetical protein GGH92_000180 [Coemansia sp. RSA 2673]|nr:hypothetical protein GGH92_000180 [Coemansia sp. RSA 2673]
MVLLSTLSPATNLQTQIFIKMERDNNIGVIAAQSLTEPLTQASLSSFHFLDKESSRDTISEFGKILSGNFDEVLIEVECSVFNPFSTFYVNFYEFSKLVTRRVSHEDVERGSRLLVAGVIDTNHYEKSKHIVSIVVASDAPYHVSFLCFYLRKKDSKHVYIPYSNERVDVVCEADKLQEIDKIVYGVSVDESKIVPCGKFDVEKYAHEDTMTFMIKGCDLETIQGIEGLVSFEFQNYTKILRYYGIEYLRDVIKEKLSFIVGDDKFSDMVADFLTYKGKFTTENSSKFMVWLKDLGTRGLEVEE